MWKSFLNLQLNNCRGSQNEGSVKTQGGLILPEEKFMKWEEKLENIFKLIDDPDVLIDINIVLTQAQDEAIDKGNKSKRPARQYGRSDAFFEIRMILLERKSTLTSGGKK